MEERRICQTEFVKSCQPVTVTDCMQVSELRCEVIWLRFSFIHVIIHSWFFSRTARWTQPWRRRRSRWWTSRRRSWRTAPRAWPQSCTPRRCKLFLMYQNQTWRWRFTTARMWRSSTAPPCGQPMETVRRCGLAPTMTAERWKLIIQTKDLRWTSEIPENCVNFHEKILAY